LGLGPAEVLRRVNQRLTERTSGGGGFITLALLTLDRQRHRIVLANAGHPRPLLRGTDGSIMELGDAEAGCALGVDATETYREAVYDFPDGAVVLLFSDGVTEARAHDGDLFGMERLRQAIGAAPSAAKDMGLAVLDAIQAFLGDQPNQDDLCLTCVSRPATSGPPDVT
jgi:phosphoserine phosphatase RsbU/P